jgi:hypothetical protein
MSPNLFLATFLQFLPGGLLEFRLPERSGEVVRISIEQVPPGDREFSEGDEVQLKRVGKKWEYVNRLLREGQT